MSDRNVFVVSTKLPPNDKIRYEQTGGQEQRFSCQSVSELQYNYNVKTYVNTFWCYFHVTRVYNLRITQKHVPVALDILYLYFL